MVRKYFYRALASNVIAVAVMETYIEDGNIKIFEWAAYISDVPGMEHSEEWQEVTRRGDKLPCNIAIVIFPTICGFASSEISYRE